MKRLFSICFLFCFGLSLFADIRNSICIVEPKLSEKNIQTLNQSEQSLSNEFYSDIAEFFKNFGQDVFGSGFFYRASDGSVFIITNRHVVQGANTADIVIRHQTGKETIIRDCQVFSVKDDLDLALLKLPKGQKIDNALVLNLAIPEDGSEIWAAGYPGLGDSPLWQFSKGEVTNGFARIDELVDRKKTVLIQHSAPIDSGNSGGPLLVKSQNKYQVVGINTWKATRRQATNFAIPAKVLKEFIDSSVAEKNSKVLELRLKERIQDIFNLFKIYDREKKNGKNTQLIRISRLSNYLADEMLVDGKAEKLISILRSAPSHIRSEALSLGFSVPLEALKFSYAYFLEEWIYNLKDKSCFSNDVADFEFTIDNDLAKFTFELDENSVLEFSFVYTKQSWRLSEMLLNGSSLFPSSQQEVKEQEVKEQEKEAKKVLFKRPYNYLIGLEYSFERDIAKFDASVVDINFSYNLNYFALGIILGRYIPHEEVSQDPLEKFLAGMRMGVFLRGQLPFYISKTFSIIPYLDFRVASRMGVFEDALFLPYGYFRTGLNFKIGDEISAVLLVGYNFFLNFVHIQSYGHAVSLGVSVGL